MARVYEIADFRPNLPANEDLPPSRNQQLLAEITFAWNNRSPEEIRLAEILGTKEELEAVQRRYDRLVETSPPSITGHLKPGDIARSNQPYDPGQSPGKERDNGLEP